MMVVLAKPPTTRYCGSCKKTKPLADWSPKGTQAYCRRCMARRNRRWREKMRKTDLARREQDKRAWYEANKNTLKKLCRGCDRKKLLRCFRYPGDGINRATSRCRSCLAKSSRRYYGAHKRERCAATRAYYLAHHAEIMANRRRRRAAETEERSLGSRCSCGADAGGTLAGPGGAAIPVPLGICASCCSSDGINGTERRVISALRVMGGSACTSALGLELGGGDGGVRLLHRGMKTLLPRGRIRVVKPDIEQGEDIFENTYILVGG